MHLANIQKIIAPELNLVEEIIYTNLDSKITAIDELCHHIMHSGGKRIRPLVLLLMAKALQYTGHQHLSLAASIEYFHTATLLHDDVIDESKLRRGKTTAHKIWNSKLSILVGDYLFAKAFQLANGANTMIIAKLLADTAHKITCAEIKQLNNRFDPDITQEHYFNIIQHKTSVLFALASELAAIIASSDSNIRKNLAKFGIYLGNAFQIVDDALDYCGSQHKIGKNIGDDLAEGKPTLPLIHAMRVGNPAQIQLIKRSISSGKITNIATILEIIQYTKAIEYTYQIAKQQITKAKALLTVIPGSPYKQALNALLEFIVTREA